MKLLLDTQVFLWLVQSPEKVSKKPFESCNDPSNLLLFSLVSVWELQIKSQLGKLAFNMPLREMVEEQQRLNGIQILPIRLEHILNLNALPDYHKDPFDRLLIAQAIQEELTLISSDSQFENYPVHLLW
jgi:PIN domain nuclease of toxin-antitoxin system